MSPAPQQNNLYQPLNSNQSFHEAQSEVRRRFYLRRKFLHRVEGGRTKSYDGRGLWCYQLYNDGGGQIVSMMKEGGATKK